MRASDAVHRAGAGAPPATQQQQRSGVTLAMVEGWCAAARDKASMGAVRNIIKVWQPGLEPLLVVAARWDAGYQSAPPGVVCSG